MKRKTLAALLLILFSLLTLSACGGGNSHAGVTAVPVQTPSAETPAVAPEEAEKADYFEAVFDTSQDAGKLTVRYLYMTKDTPSVNSSITTGDCSVYTSPEGKIMLVDCSNSASADEVIAQLRAMDIEKIDILVCSHPHADHIGGFAKVAETFEIGQIYMNDHEYDSDTYRGMMDIIRAKGIPYAYLYDGDSFLFGDQVEVNIYNPIAGGNEEIGAGYMDANDYSIAMRLRYQEASFWTSGDLYVSGEQALLDRYGSDICSDIMKMNHHGWSTSNLKGFIEALDPLAAVGMHDSVTSQTVALRFSTRGILTFFNCMDGAVRISSDGSRTYDIQCQFVRDQDLYGEPAADGHYVVSADAAGQAA